MIVGSILAQELGFEHPHGHFIVPAQQGRRSEDPVRPGVMLREVAICNADL